MRGAKQRALLTCLALRRGEVVLIDQLAEAIWGEFQPANPANALQAQVSAVRKVLPGGVLLTRGSGYALDLSENQLDIAMFDAMSGAGLRLLELGEHASAADKLAAALALWRGPPLAEFAYAEFARFEIARLEEARLSAVEARVEADLALGRHGEVVVELEILCAEHPLRERLWAHRMVALYRCGRQAEALRAFSEAREHLVDELGIEPGPELRRLEAMILAHDAELQPPRPPTTGRSRGNFRPRLTTFVGREDEVKDALGTLETNRLLTLVGPGGAGKTRLALEVAERFAEAQGVEAWFVELAAVGDPAAVISAISMTLMAGDAASSRDPPSEPLERIAAVLTGHRALIVLDNCEHVISETAKAAEELLASVSGLRVIATSRESLRVPGEVLLPVPPLPEHAAVELFCDRARTVDRTFVLGDETRSAVAELCHRLDGLPLAIELAAARLRSLPVRVLTQRLDDRFRLLTGGARTALPRHQTLRAVVDWSYDLLFKDEQQLFARLSVFPAGCTSEAAKAVCADEDVAAEDIEELLARLVDKSLLVVDVDPDGEPRYHQLQTLWQYARERLAESQVADDVRERQARWCLRLAQGAEEGLRGENGPAWRARISAEIENLRAGLDWLIDRGDARAACLLARRIAWWWFLRADWLESSRWLRDALATNGPLDPLERARTETWHAYFAAVVEDPSRHVEVGRTAFELVRQHGSPLQIGEVALLHASTLNRALHFEEALRVLDVAREVHESADHRWGLAMNGVLVANATARLGRFDEAERAAESAVEQFGSIGENLAQIEPMGTIAGLREARGDIAGAIAAYERVIEVTRPLDLPGYLAHWLVARGALAARTMHDSTAVAYFSEAIELSRNPTNTAIALVGRGRAAFRSGAKEEQAIQDLSRAAELFGAVGRRDGRAATLVALGLGDMNHGSPDVMDLLAEAADLDEAMAQLLAAGAAVARLDFLAATERLDAWDEAHLPAMPGSLGAVLRRDRDILRAAIGA